MTKRNRKQMHHTIRYFGVAKQWLLTKFRIRRSDKVVSWSKEEILKTVHQYGSPREFKHAQPEAYQLALEQKWLGEINAKMNW
ncbi:hypothetical protein N9L54_01605 [Porticoccaceae bacterium]|nr:hypothetical protein [Porticoccaceae bacterium]